MRQFGAGSPQSQVRLLSLLDSTAALVRPEEAHEASSKSVMNVLSFFFKDIDKYMDIQSLQTDV